MTKIDEILHQISIKNVTIDIDTDTTLLYAECADYDQLKTDLYNAIKDEVTGEDEEGQRGGNGRELDSYVDGVNKTKRLQRKNLKKLFWENSTPTPDTHTEDEGNTYVIDQNGMKNYLNGKWKWKGEIEIDLEYIIGKLDAVPTSNHSMCSRDQWVREASKRAKELGYLVDIKPKQDE